jgi:hypothetical protein
MIFFFKKVFKSLGIFPSMNSETDLTASAVSLNFLNACNLTLKLKEKYTVSGSSLVIGK